MTDDIHIPNLLYLANKSENGFEGDILSDFYKLFPHAATDLDPVDGQPIAPIFVSAEHGDGLPDFY